MHKGSEQTTNMGINRVNPHVLPYKKSIKKEGGGSKSV